MGPTVVHIESKKGVRRGQEEAGSGVIVQFEKYPTKFFVLTNGHVIRDAPNDRIKIKLSDGRELQPAQVWMDSPTDIALMEIKAPDLVAARFGDSNKLEIGDYVLAIGSPFGLSHSVTFGIISAKGRRDLDLGDGEVKYKEFLQTDAAINPGNSGGPLVNLRSEVVGINTAIASNSGGSEGIGFSIPINMVKTIADQLLTNGSVLRAFLGVTLDRDFNPTAATKLGLTTPRGAHITGIRDNTPAAAAKLRTGDVILEFDGVRIENDIHLVNMVSLTSIGKEVSLTVWREGKPVQMKVQVGDREKLAPEPK
jgi:serine protease Do